MCFDRVPEAPPDGALWAIPPPAESEVNCYWQSVSRAATVVARLKRPILQKAWRFELDTTQFPGAEEKSASRLDPQTHGYRFG